MVLATTVWDDPSTSTSPTLKWKSDFLLLHEFSVTFPRIASAKEKHFPCIVFPWTYESQSRHIHNKGGLVYDYDVVFIAVTLRCWRDDHNNDYNRFGWAQWWNCDHAHTFCTPSLDTPAKPFIFIFSNEHWIKWYSDDTSFYVLKCV